MFSYFYVLFLFQNSNLLYNTFGEDVALGDHKVS